MSLDKKCMRKNRKTGLYEAWWSVTFADKKPKRLLKKLRHVERFVSFINWIYRS